MRPIETTDDLARDIVADPRWFPLRFNPETKEYHFARVPAEVHRDIAFLKDLRPAPADTRVLPRLAVSNAACGGSALHLILHSGLGGSTLLARALGQAGVATALQEPPILTDVIAYGLTNSAGETNALLDDVTRLLSRSLSAGEATVCKMNSISNGLGIPMAAVHPGSQIVCLETQLEEMLSSFASRGIEGRMAGRKLLIGIRNSRMLPIELSDKELAELTDLQMTALSWLSMRKAMLDAAETFGSKRVRSIKSEQLVEDTRDALVAISRHYRLDLDVDERLASGVFDRHAKTGEPFNAKRRAERVVETLRVHGQEIEPVVSWTRRVAETTGIAWDLPYPLLD